MIWLFITLTLVTSANATAAHKEQRHPASVAAQSGAHVPREIDWDRAIEDTEKLTTIAGILIGGIWAYFKFFRGRVFVPRLETGLSTKIISMPQGKFFIASLMLKNVGLSRVDLHQRGTALRLAKCQLDSPIPRPEAVAWEKIRAFVIFQDHKWIESGETIRDEIMFASPAAGYAAFRLELRVIGSLQKLSSDSRHIAWREVRIVGDSEVIPTCKATDGGDQP
jgi:hypothetical protein